MNKKLKFNDVIKITKDDLKKLSKLPKNTKAPKLDFSKIVLDFDNVTFKTL